MRSHATDLNWEYSTYGEMDKFCQLDEAMRASALRESTPPYRYLPSNSVEDSDIVLWNPPSARLHAAYHTTHTDLLQAESQIDNHLFVP
jgi:hypothetical protein